MANPNDISTDLGGLQPNQNEINVSGTPLSVAKNLIINREGMLETRRGFSDFSSNLPINITPDQIFESGGVLYANTDSGFWYFDTSTSSWLRKRGSVGIGLTAINGAVYFAGHIYITTGDHTVVDFNVSTGDKTILAGRQGSFGHTDGTGDAARFTDPSGLVCDGTNLYVCDFTNNCIRKIVISTKVVTTPYGVAAPLTTAAHTDGTGNAARFSGPNSVVSDGTNLYVADRLNSCIRKVVISSGVVTTPYGVADPATTTGHTDATGNAARFNNPNALSSDGTNLYISDTANNCIRKVVISSGVVTTPYGVADPGTTSGHVDATGNASRFDTPIGSYYDGTNLYVADFVNNCIRKIVISTGVVTTPYGVAAPGNTSGTTDAIGNSARFTGPVQIASDGIDLYVGDNGSSRFRKIYVATGYVSTIDGGSLNTVTTVYPFMSGYVQGPS